jgi:hypothetical protein
MDDEQRRAIAILTALRDAAIALAEAQAAILANLQEAADQVTQKRATH